MMQTMADKKMGRLYLIPSPLGEAPMANMFPPENLSAITKIDHFIVENEKSARRFIGDVYRYLHSEKKVYNLEFFLLNINTQNDEIPELLVPLVSGHDTGIISEAGCPGVADPGALVVEAAHEKGIEVIPLVGPSSILLAVMASGLSGQNFAFIGYLPKDREGRKNRLRELERISRKTGQTQVFIETPYRNQYIAEDSLDILDPKTRLCIACDLTLATQWIQTHEVGQWKGRLPAIEGRPSVFLISSQVNK